MGDTLKLSVTAQDMIAKESDTNYYAIKSDDSQNNGGTATGGFWASEAKSPVAGTIKLENAGENDTVKCKVSVQTDLSGTMVGYLKEGDVKLTLSGLDDMFEGVTEIDLSKDSQSGGKFTFSGDQPDEKTASATFTGVRDLQLTTQESEKELKADVWLVNKMLTDQNELAGKELKVKLTLQVTECTTTSTGE